MMILLAKRRKETFNHLIFVYMLFLILGCGPGNSDENMLRIGLMEEPRTTNIWLASDTNSRKVLSLIYQPLYTYDPDTLELVPWLAAAMPQFDPETISYTVALRHAKWSDGTPVTADDVVFTVDLIRRFKVPRYFSQWQFVEKTVAVDDTTVRFFLSEPRAIFLTKTLVNYIVPKSQWAPIAQQAENTKKPLVALLNAKISSPMGSGPYVIEQWRQGAFLHLINNPHFFGKNLVISNRRLGPYADSILFKIYSTADVAILALKRNAVDYFWWPIQPGYIDGLRGNENTKVYLSDRSALYYMGFNVRHAPFSDPAIRRAVSFLIDKEFIIERVLQGFAAPMDSIVPSENTFWHADGLPRYGRGMTRSDRIKAAYRLLSEGGYTWDRPPVNDAGSVVSPSRIILPDGQPMADFAILTPPADYDPARATCGVIIQEWLKDLGLPASARPMSFGALLQRIKDRHDFETFILGYGQLSLDPDYLRNFFHSANDRPGGWNMSGYRNPVFDRLADESGKAMDPSRRRYLVNDMQRIIMADVPYIPLYNPVAIEAVNTNRFAHWEQMIDGIGNIWSICRVRPQTRQAARDIDN
ncbi:ABC transporter substrate-binding protein [Desulfatitalea alkaliphila]|uniref:ABC transporter substrate-binding protein n=1 Tax=Desulfatitalea alkaliphila TaxID=2929485 RepID=A0AA41ULG8_9BACT|nr:ABC transporter substrate-binding protein [Desulfatitalea alkaliphila]MCJ8501496.1 ABC transporter substrate-binding protein [Desulfatitalea alkaliphila]